MAARAITHQAEVERVLDSYRTRIGRAETELATPSLVLDRQALGRNIAELERRLAGSARLRPHAKTHKSPEIARLQLDAGAIGITVATAWEALALARAGIDDLLVANEIWGSERQSALVEAATRTAVTVAVDDSENAQELSHAARAGEVELGVLIDVDVGLGRCGVRRAQDAAALAIAVEGLPGLRLRGVPRCTRAGSRSIPTASAAQGAPRPRPSAGRRPSARSRTPASRSRSSPAAEPEPGTRQGSRSA
jgi:D-serine deaminase-like pyridoxal phosphate-dependent protein